jgi:cytochrome c
MPPLCRRAACAGLFLCCGLTLAHADDQLARGERLYQERCGACHSLEEHGAGPKHRGLIGRKAGTRSGFDYSAALAASNLVWSAQTLERWIADPNALVPGNNMIVQLANDPADRAAIIAYLVASTKM